MATQGYVDLLVSHREMSFDIRPLRTFSRVSLLDCRIQHDDVIKWKHFPRYWPFVRRIHRSPVNSPHEGQWRGVFMFSLICVWINDWVNNGEAGDLRRYLIHYDVTVMNNILILDDIGHPRSLENDGIHNMNEEPCIGQFQIHTVVPIWGVPARFITLFLKILCPRF